MNIGRGSETRGQSLCLISRLQATESLRMKTGVLLMNTGTADAPNVEAIRRYLREFLSDPAIIGAPAPIRNRIVNHIVKNRPPRTLANYEAFWTEQGSPFIIASNSQAEKLEAELNARGIGEFKVELGMRYGNPSIANALGALREADCEQLVLLPAYPQQTNVCAGTCINRARAALADMKAASGWNPIVSDALYFYDLPAYKDALAKQVAKHWRYEPGAKLVVSFHSTMLADIKAGDPYKAQTEQTAAWLAEALNVPAKDYIVSYQSRFDNRKWLQPFTEPTVLGLAASGVKNLCIVCPIFTAENMETALEINRDLRGSYLAAAPQGASFTYVPALNASDGLIAALADATEKALSGGFKGEQSGIGSTADTSVPGMLH